MLYTAKGASERIVDHLASAKLAIKNRPLNSATHYKSVLDLLQQIEDPQERKLIVAEVRTGYDTLTRQVDIVDNYANSLIKVRRQELVQLASSGASHEVLEDAAHNLLGTALISVAAEKLRKELLSIEISLKLAEERSI